MRVLVTGSSGFVGRHLVAALRSSGVDVVAAVRERDVPGTTSVGDIGPQTDWSAALEGVDTVVHLAAVAHVVSGPQPGPATYQRVNVGGTSSLAVAAKERGVGAFILMSSISAVSSVSGDPVHELTTPATRTAYGQSKLDAERVVREIFAGSGTGWVALRPPLVYGPGNPGNMARLVRLVERRVPIPVGGIENRRSLIYVGNLVDAVAAVIAAGPGNDIFNVADAEVVSSADLVRLIGDAISVRPRVWSIPGSMLRGAGRLGDGLGRVSRRRFPLDSRSVEGLIGSLEVDISKIRSLWSPAVSTSAGIRRSYSDQ